MILGVCPKCATQIESGMKTTSRWPWGFWGLWLYGIVRLLSSKKKRTRPTAIGQGNGHSFGWPTSELAYL